MSSRTAKLNLLHAIAKGEFPGAWHTEWNTDNDSMETRLCRGGAASPVGIETGDFVGQYYIKTAIPRQLWMCTVIGAPGSWQPVTPAGDYVTLTSIAGTATINCGSGFYHKITLTENTTFAAPGNIQPGVEFTLEVTQAAGVRYTTTWNAVFKWGGLTPGIQNVPPVQGLSEKILFRFIVASNGDVVALPRSFFRQSVVPSFSQSFANSTPAVLSNLSGSFGRVGAINKINALLRIQRVDVNGTLITGRLHVGSLGSTGDPVFAEAVLHMQSLLDYGLLHLQATYNLTGGNTTAVISLASSTGNNMTLLGSADGIVRTHVVCEEQV